jgi:hypothetical protein
MKIYAVSIGAANDTQHSTMPGVIRAENDAEARGKAMEAAYREYPKSDGWMYHHAGIAQVPAEWIKELARLDTSGDMI